jgi:hypothetical protein
MREHVVPVPRRAFVAQRGNVHRCNDNSLARAGRCLGQQASIIIDDLATAGP